MRDFRVRSSHFSLDFSEIEPAILSGARGRVHPHNKGFTYRSKLGSFDKFREVGILLLWLFSTLRVVWWLSALRGMCGGILNQRKLPYCDSTH